MTNFNNEDKEFTEFLEYQKHLANTLYELQNFQSHIGFLQEENNKVCEDFFYSNLYLLYRSLNNEKINDEIKNNIANMWNNIKLYHYTDSPSLEGIISTKSLRLTCLSKMNDSAEGKSLIEKFLTRFKDEPKFKDDPRYVEILNKKSLNLLNNYYASSFTVLRNDASQWDRYGNPQKSKKKECNEIQMRTKIQENPCGVCLEVPIKKLIDLAKIMNDDFDLAEVAPVWYVPRDKSDNTYLQFGDGVFFNYIKECIRSTLHIRNSKKAIETTFEYSTDIKFDSFKKEYEVRLLLSLTDDMIHELKYVSSTSDKDVVEGKRYITIKLNELRQNFNFSEFFTSISLGPETSPEARDAVEELLKKNDLLHLLTKEDSNCTLRAKLNKK